MLPIALCALVAAAVADTFWLRVLAAGVAALCWLGRPRKGRRNVPASGMCASRRGLWSGGVRRRAGQSSDLAGDLRAALVKGSVDVRYQPIVDLAHQRIVGVEALPYWRHSRLGWITSDELSAIAVDAGLGAAVDAWVIDRSCRQLAAWRAWGWDVWLAVRITPAELDLATCAGVAAALTTHGVPPGKLVIAIPDPGGAGDAQQLETQLAGLRSLGVKIAFAGFDLGQETMRQLRRGHFDLVKGDGPAAAAVVALGRKCGFEVIARDLTDETDLAAAKMAGCRYGQGKLLGPPAPAEHIETAFSYSAAKPGIG